MKLIVFAVRRPIPMMRMMLLVALVSCGVIALITIQVDNSMPRFVVYVAYMGTIARQMKIYVVRHNES